MAIFKAPKPQLSSCNRVHVATKPKILAICSFTEKKQNKTANLWSTLQTHGVQSNRWDRQVKKKKKIYIYTHTHIYICYSMLRTHSWYSEHTVETYGSSVLKYRKDSHKRREIREVVFYLLFILKYFYMPFSLIQVCELLHERNTMLISVTFIF